MAIFKDTQVAIGGWDSTSPIKGDKKEWKQRVTSRSGRSQHWEQSLSYISVGHELSRMEYAACGPFWKWSRCDRNRFTRFVPWPNHKFHALKRTSGPCA